MANGKYKSFIRVNNEVFRNLNFGAEHTSTDLYWVEPRSYIRILCTLLQEILKHFMKLTVLLKLCTTLAVVRFLRFAVRSFSENSKTKFLCQLIRLTLFLLTQQVLFFCERLVNFLHFEMLPNFLHLKVGFH